MGSQSVLKIDENSTLLRHIIAKFQSMVNKEKSQVKSREREEKKKQNRATQETRIRLAPELSTRHWGVEDNRAKLSKFWGKVIFLLGFYTRKLSIKYRCRINLFCDRYYLNNLPSNNYWSYGIVWSTKKWVNPERETQDSRKTRIPT